MRDGQKRDFARQLRGAMSDAESALWRRLRRRQLMDWRFRRQVPIGPYIADFACLEKNLVTEVDGGQHNALVDADRTVYFEARGFTLLRFWNNDVLGNVEGVCEMILGHLGDTRAPIPAFPRRRGKEPSIRALPRRRGRETGDEQAACVPYAAVSRRRGRR
jgi:very-short-patch-repair endonuclease